MFSKILIANRGEIAVRIIRACKEMGIETVAVYSEADADALHVALADESYCIGPELPAESYLNEERIISTALASRAQAIHPGYGFLSENPHFAELCVQNGVAFIGASVEQMKTLSDKVLIKNIMEDAGLKVIRGSEVLESVDDALEKAESIGYPVMLKARSGGGGKGIKVITDAEMLQSSYGVSEAEAQAAFGDGSLYLEKYVYPAHHIEVQILADEYGEVICLGDRDCSIQRRHQKLIEETPSPAVPDDRRKELFIKAVQAIRKVGYSGVGTLEFLMDSSGEFWFMEMNVRLQVEHSVTEMLTKKDVVKWQIRTAAGVAIDFSQESVYERGVALECRINALRPGKLEMLHVPGGPFVRFDTYLVQGVQISPCYDPLLGKLIVSAGTREEAVRKMRAALCELVIEGIDTNIEEQLEIVSDDKFMSGGYDLTFMEGR